MEFAPGLHPSISCGILNEIIPEDLTWRKQTY